MYNISWKSDYGLGHSLIDKEHKYLFEIAAQAFEPVVPELRKAKIKKTIDSLNEYMKVHFVHEEIFMRVIDYPYHHNHEVIHESIIKNMQSLVTKLYTLSIKDFEQELAFFVETALVGHIMQEDRKIHDWYKNKKGERRIVEWNDKYLIGEKEIDDNYKVLFEIAHEAFAKGDLDSSKDKIKDILHRLSLYTSSQFKCEEEFMKKMDYPQYEAHCKKHKTIIKKINAFSKEITAMDTQEFELELELDLAIFIEKWLVQHIICEDKKIKTFIKTDKKSNIDIAEL